MYVIEGEPDVWLDGHLHRLKPGDAVGFPAGTGIAHSFLNNTEAEVHLLVVGERSKPENRIFYPLNPDRKALHDDWWDDHPSARPGSSRRIAGPRARREGSAASRIGTPTPVRAAARQARIARGRSARRSSAPTRR